MKKLIALLCAAVMTFSLTSCGGSSKEPAVPVSSTVTETPSATPSATPEATKAEASEATKAEPSAEPKEPELSEYDKAKQAILDHIDVAYTGETSAGAPMYFLAGSEGEYVALVLENSDGKRYIKFVGSSVIDDDTGILTVTDDETGHTFGFTAEKQADGSFFLDCGNLGECYLEPDDPGNVVDSIIDTFRNKKDVTDETVIALAEQSISDYIDVAYFGITEAGGAMYYLASSDGSFAALIIENADETGYIKFVGTTSVDANGVQTVKDEETGYSFGFIAEDQGDGSYFLDCGELGTCYVEPDNTEKIMEFVSTTFEEMEDITDAYMAKYGR